MRLFSSPERNFDGMEKAVGPASVGQVLPALAGSFWGWLREPFSGAWQKNIVPEQPQNIMAFSAVYACVTLVADDISKLRIKLVEQDKDGIWNEVTKDERNSPFLSVIKKPNRYQTRIQFINQWVTSKLMHGNAYVLKDRDARKVVRALYVLNPFYVTPLVGSDGSVWYQINLDWLAGVDKSITVPASEMIHDRCSTLWHPLVGVSPIYASGASATQGIRIQANSAKFFENMSRPSGQLTAPGTIDEVTSLRLKREFEENFSGGNIGRLLVAGDGLKYEPLAIPPAEAQMIEQLKWTVEDVARSHKVPFYKLGGALPAGLNVPALNQDYYSQTLQIHIESIELLLEEGLELPQNPFAYGVELDLDGLLRMDPLGRAEAYAKLITSAVYAPNEARFRENLKPVEGGDSPMIQQQNYSLKALAKRDASDDPFGTAKKPDPTPTPALPAPAPEPSPPPTPAKAAREVIEGEFVVEKDTALFEDMVENATPLMLMEEVS